MTSFRDLNCGNDVAMMDKLGRFDREFIVYGCAFLQKDEPHYFVSSRADTIDHFVQQSSLASLYPTPVSTALSACSVPAGAQSELARSAKMTLARELSHTYSPLFWQKLQKLTALPANNTGAQLIEERFAQLNGCFQPESLSLMAGLLQMTFAQKRLTLAAYQNFWARLEKKLRQMEDDVVIKKTFRRTFSGFAYRPPKQRWQYFYDGESAAVRAKQRLYFSQGMIVTPMVQKTYWFDGQTSVQSIAQRFAQALPEWFDADFLALTEALRALPPLGEVPLFSSTEWAELSFQEQAALRGYAYCYHLLPPQA